MAGVIIGKWFRHSLIFLFVLILHCMCASRDEVIFYEDSFYEGDRMFLTMASGCYNFESDWNNRASSVEPNGQCIMAYDKMDCMGASVKLEPGVRGLGQLRRLDFDNAISSVSACSNGREKHRKSDENGPEIWRIGVQEHNKYRRMHGVPDLKGDPELHDLAQTHANYLVKHHKLEASDNQYGENIATSYKKEKAEAIRDVVARWYDKIEFYDFRNPDSNRNKPQNGQFASIIWKSSSFMGIGIAWNKLDEKWVVVANYDPAAKRTNFRENVPPPLRQLNVQEPVWHRTRSMT